MLVINGFRCYDVINSSKMQVTKRAFLSLCYSNYPEFVNRFSRVQPQCAGMLGSELLCVYTLVKLLGIDLIIESGVENGVSTQALASLLPEVKIISVDFQCLESTRERLRKFQNVSYIQFDSIEHLPGLVKGLSAANKIFALIDGPKDDLALALSKQLIDNVECLACHDVGFEFCHSLNREGTNEDTFANFTGWNMSQFITTEEWYSSHFSHLNINALNWLMGCESTGWEQRNDGYDSVFWNPILQNINPIGFGLGVASTKLNLVEGWMSQEKHTLAARIRQSLT